MARRNSRPSLYEVGRQRLDKTGQRVDEPDGVEAEGPSQQRLVPGSSVRLPLGFIFVGAVVVVATVIGAWWIGRGAGVEEVQRDIRASGQGRVEVDPLAGRVAPDVAEIDGEVPDTISQPVVLPMPEAPASVDTGASEGKNGDPRLLGQWYFVLAETRWGGAEEIAAFCRQQGLDVAVVSSHNARLAKVIALPGLSSARATSSAFQDLDARIEAVGRRWRESGRRTSFADRYLQLKGDTP
jgi:hypothetical protein